MRPSRLIAEGRRGEAFRLLVEARGNAQADLHLLDSIIAGMIKVREFTSALELSIDSLIKYPNDIRLLLRAIEIRSLMVDLTDVPKTTDLMQDLDQLTTRDDFVPSLWNAVSIIYERIRQFKSALHAASKAVDVANDSVNALHRVIWIYLVLGKERAASKILRTLLHKEGLGIAHLRGSADWAHRCGEPKVALQFARKQHAMNPTGRDIDSIFM